MKVYNLPVDFTYQNFGSAWLGILRGTKENIELTFNGIYNLMGAKSLEYQDHGKTVATFWTNRKAMRRFFFNRFFLSRMDGNMGKGHRVLVRQSMHYAHRKLYELKGHQEMFLNYLEKGKDILDTEYAIGNMVGDLPRMRTTQGAILCAEDVD